MALIDDIQNIKDVTYKSKICGVEHLLNKLPAKERDAVALAVDDPNYQISLLYKVFKQNGYDISTASLYRHRRRFSHGGCRCL
jgi:hypothetical protein